MKNISIIVHYPTDAASINHIEKITNDTYLIAVEKLITKSSMERKMKIQAVERIIRRFKAT
jgi:hypothetical protein